MENMEDLSKMKVADLKKHLKSRGLPVTGNKTELVDRLQEALQSDDNPTLDSSGGAVVDDDEFDEEEILGGEDVDIKITQEEEAAALAGNIRVKNDSILMTDTQPEKKKISLKRSEPCLSCPAETSAPSEENATAEPELSTNSNNDKENSLTANSEEPKRKLIKLTGLNSENAVEERAKKFGTVTNDSDEGRKVARAERFGGADSSNTSKNVKAPKLSMETGGTDLEKLKKRAERFGEVTSKSLSKLEILEKMKRRQERFSSGSSENEKKDEKSPEVDNEAAKTARANRFGTSTENTKKTPVTAPATDDDAKAKRAQRFAV